MEPLKNGMVIQRSHMFALFFLFLIVPIKTIAHQKSADLIVFSYDRPLQLHALLSSMKQYVTNINTTFVIYRSSNEFYDHAYQEVMTLFSDTQFFKQGTEPKKDFKPLTLNCLNQTNSTHVLFATDDDIITDYVDINQCVEILETTGAYGFYLRLGTNITHSYYQNIALTLPPMADTTPDIVSFSFDDGQSYWAYPNNVDMTIYNKSIIQPAFTQLSYYSPNILESRWARLYKIIGRGLCFKKSKGVNLPLNIAQDDWHNKNEELFSTTQLLNLWNQGYTMDISSFYKINNCSAHMPYTPTFIQRPVVAPKEL